MPILPSIRPVSPLSNAVTAQANSTLTHGSTKVDAEKASRKIGRQLSLNSHGNHYADVHRQEAERALNGIGNHTTVSTKESFFSHLRKRARRLSGRNQAAANTDDVDTSSGCMPWSNRSSLALDPVNIAEAKQHSEVSELDKALQNVKCALDTTNPTTLGNVPVQITSPVESTFKRSSIPQGSIRSVSDGPLSMNSINGTISSRTRRALQMTGHPVHRYETPEEEDELLDEALQSANKAAKSLAQAYFLNDESSNNNRQPLMGNDNSHPLPSPYPTPSPSAKCEGIFFGQNITTPCRRDAKVPNGNPTRQWPTPPYEEDEWTNTTSTGVFATGSTYR